MIRAEPQRSACEGAIGSSAWLGRAGELDGLVQRLGRDVRAVRPYDSAPVDEESLEVVLILQRFEDRPFEPGLKIDRALHVVNESEMNAKTTFVLSPNDGWQGVHRRYLIQAVQCR